jgi:hypothetical protein
MDDGCRLLDKYWRGGVVPLRQVTGTGEVARNGTAVCDGEFLSWWPIREADVGQKSYCNMYREDA